VTIDDAFREALDKNLGPFAERYNISIARMEVPDEDRNISK